MAETLLSFGVEKLWNLLVRESERFQGVGEQFNKLESDLSLLRSFLKDADSKKYTIETVKSCLEQIKEIVFDTEDILETFLLKEELRKTKSFKKCMRSFSCIVMESRKLAFDIEDLNNRICKVTDDMKNFGVQQIVVECSEYLHPLQVKQREKRKTFSSNNENNLVGLEENVKKLIGYLVEEDNIQIVSITGMGGIGKTTLARQVINHEMVKNHFDGVVWVCVSQQFTRKYVWKMIFKRLSPKYDEERDSNMTEDELQGKLFRVLETSNSSLIVLDDMWKEEDWDMIKPVFPTKKGWKVLLTSRNERVALHADPTCVTFKSKCLTLEESWTLFQRIAFPRKDTAEYKVDVEMEKMGKQMVKHCGGLPLAVKLLGGLLATRHTLTEWKRVFENIGFHIIGGTSFNERNISSVYHILYLSFEELPNYLKQCFLYFAHFPEDWPICLDELSYLWAAEGIPRPRNYESASIRDVADVYIEELVTRNMIISERDALTSRFEKCQLHDMMRDVCLRKAIEENFLHILPSTSTADSESRRLSIHFPPEKFDVEGEMKNSKLRSLLLMKEKFDMITWNASGLFFTKLKLMRVLDISGVVFNGAKLPSSIGKLVHLRYLSLYNAWVSYLPSSMRNLKKLLYLNLDVIPEPPVHMPNFLNEMRELVYLHLPGKIHDNVKIELSNLVNLETLKNFSTKNSSVKDLHTMTRLENISINYNGGCNLETLSLSLNGLRHLEDFQQLDMKINVPTSLGEQHLPSYLTSIFLQDCLLKEDPMSILEKLPNLKKVNLFFQSFCGSVMVCSAGGFPQLQKLSLYGLDELEEWKVEEGSMPLLHTLDIAMCVMLKELPDGLRFITSLKKLIIYTDNLVKEKEWYEKLSSGGEDYYKVKHISCVNFGKSINESVNNYYRQQYEQEESLPEGISH